MPPTPLSRLVSRPRRSSPRALLVALLLAGTAAAQEAPPAAAPPAAPRPRPRIALVLSGGGARGAAHVGVLKVMEELRVPVDFVVGTSMGAIVGGLWASGLTAAEIEGHLDGLDWQEAFTDKTPRHLLAFRRRQDDDGLFMKPRVGLQNGKATLPLGLVQGQRLGPLLRAMTLHVATVDDFDRLPVPFRAVATDIVSGEKVVIGTGDLVSAIRASMAVPGAFAPVERNGQLLVDGALADNLPVDVARATGAEVIIAVDISARPVALEALGSAVAIGDQMITILMRQSTDRQLAALGPGDLLIVPDLGAFSQAAFADAAKAIAIGEQAARAVSGRLAAFSLPAAPWAVWSAHKAQRSTAPPDLEEVRLTHDTRLDTALLSRRMTVRPGHPFDQAQVEHDLERLYGLDLFEKVSYELLPGERGGAILDIAARRKSWGTQLPALRARARRRPAGRHRLEPRAAAQRPRAVAAGGRVAHRPALRRGPAAALGALPAGLAGPLLLRAPPRGAARGRADLGAGRRRRALPAHLLLGGARCRPGARGVGRGAARRRARERRPALERGDRPADRRGVRRRPPLPAAASPTPSIRSPSRAAAPAASSSSRARSPSSAPTPTPRSPRAA